METAFWGNVAYRQCKRLAVAEILFRRIEIAGCLAGIVCTA